MNAKGDVKEEDKFIKARKSFFNRFGQPINPSNVKQGDLIAVKLTLENMERSKVENIALADILPADLKSKIQNWRSSRYELDQRSGIRRLSGCS